jgi:hypothetical protein
VVVGVQEVKGYGETAAAFQGLLAQQMCLHLPPHPPKKGFSVQRHCCKSASLGPLVLLPAQHSRDGIKTHCLFMGGISISGYIHRQKALFTPVSMGCFQAACTCPEGFILGTDQLWDSLAFKAHSGDAAR